MKEKLSHIGETARSPGCPHSKRERETAGHEEVHETELETRLFANMSSQETPCWRK